MSTISIKLLFGEEVSLMTMKQIKRLLILNKQAPGDSKLSDPPKDSGYVGSGLVYAGPVEYGRADMPNYPRQPYIRPALDYSKNKREARHKQIIDAAIKQAYHG